MSANDPLRTSALPCPDPDPSRMSLSGTIRHKSIEA
jgi:hypothetical protein